MTFTASTASGARITSAPALGPERQVASACPSFPDTSPTVLKSFSTESHTFPKIEAQLFFRSGNAAPPSLPVSLKLRRPSFAPAPPIATAKPSRNICAAWAPISALAPALIPARSRFPASPNPPMACLRCRRSRAPRRISRRANSSASAARNWKTCASNAPLPHSSGDDCATLFGAHPYAIVAPSEAQVESYRRENLEEYYAAHYVPSDALLVIVGDFKTPQCST